MSEKYKFDDPNGVYFITSTVITGTALPEIIVEKRDYWM
jgi:hypothetical protein